MEYQQRSAYEVVIASSLKSNFERYLTLCSEIAAYKERFSGSEEEKKQGYFQKFGLSINEARLNVFLNSAVLVEAVANVYLSLKTDPHLFEVFSNLNIVQKWFSAPKLFNNKYSIDKEGQLYEELLHLKQIRDAIVHLKPEVYIDGKKVHKGKNPKKIAEDHEFCLRAATLPFRLIENLLKFDRSFAMDAHSILQYKPEAVEI